MKITILAAAAALALAGTGFASAQTTNAGTDANANTRAGGVHVQGKAHVKRHRATTGIETRDNNASANGSLLPGKDRLNSKAYLQDR
jgi:hypothetical protein